MRKNIVAISATLIILILVAFGVRYKFYHRKENYPFAKFQITKIKINNIILEKKNRWRMIKPRNYLTDSMFVKIRIAKIESLRLGEILDHNHFDTYGITKGIRIALFDKNGDSTWFTIGKIGPLSQSFYMTLKNSNDIYLGYGFYPGIFRSSIESYLDKRILNLKTGEVDSIKVLKGKRILYKIATSDSLMPKLINYLNNFRISKFLWDKEILKPNYYIRIYKKNGVENLQIESKTKGNPVIDADSLGLEIYSYDFNRVIQLVKERKNPHK